MFQHCGVRLVPLCKVLRLHLRVSEFASKFIDAQHCSLQVGVQLITLARQHGCASVCSCEHGLQQLVGWMLRW